MLNKIKNQAYRFLRKTQKYTGTDNVYLAKGGFWLMSGQTISALASLLLAVAFANLLDPTIYGNYRYLLSIAGILGIFSLSGIRTAMIQAAARGLEGFFYTGFKASLKWGILGSALSAAGGVYYLMRGNELLPAPLFMIALFLPILNASKIFDAFLLGKKLFGKAIKYSSVVKIASTITLVCALFFTKNLTHLILAWLASYAALNCFFYLITRQKFKPNKKEDRRTLAYSKHLSLLDLISITADYLDKILLFTMIGANQLAVYSFAVVIPAYIRNTMSGINVLAMPKFSANPEKKISRETLKKIYKLFLATALIIAVYIIIAPYVYKIFFPKYIESIIYSQIFALSLISLPATLLISFFQAKMMKKQLYLLKITPFLRAILFIALIPTFGIWGAIMSILATETFNIGFILFLSQRA